MGKGSSGGGGGGTGVVEYPAYMETIHSDWVDNTGADTSTDSVTDIMNAALGNSPWIGQTPYDPDADITAYEAAISGFDTILAGITETTEWADLFAQAVTSITIGDVTVVDESVSDAVAVVDSTVSDVVVADKTIVDKSVSGITDAEIIIDSAAFGASLDDQIITTVLPRFQGGMRDINAVVSSAFVIGQSIIESFKDRDVAKHESGLRVSAEHKNADIDISVATINLSKDVSMATSNLTKDTDVATVNLNKNVGVATANLSKDVNISTSNLTKNVNIANMNIDKEVKIGTANLSKDVNIAQIRNSAADQMIRLLIQKYAWEEAYTKIVVEGKRIKIVAKKEENDLEIKIDEADALWDLEVFQYGSNLLASIGGGTVSPGGKEPSTAQSMIGGAMSGAAAGAMLGGPWAAVIGGVLGAASALL